MRIPFPHKIRAMWKAYKHKIPRRAERIGLGILIVLLGIWFCTPLPTATARYVWRNYHAGSLALFLDQSDTGLALGIGDYYFGNQLAVNSTEHPYDLSLAKKASEKAIKINSSVAFAHYMRGRIEFVQGNFNEALTDFNKELSLYPANKRPLYMRGLVYAYRGQEGDLLLAENDFRAFVTWAPTEWAGYNDLAFVFAKEKKYNEAALTLKEGITKANGGATNSWLWNALGVMELNLNRPKEAVSALMQAQKYASSLTDSNWRRAYPGNNPSTAQTGLESMKAGIARNLIKAYAALEK